MPLPPSLPFDFDLFFATTRATSRRGRSPSTPKATLIASAENVATANVSDTSNYVVSRFDASALDGEVSITEDPQTAVSPCETSTVE